MTQYVRPAQAFGAVSAAIAQNASPESTNQNRLHKRLTAKLGVKKGTTQYGTIRSLNTNERHLAMPDNVYAAAVAAGVDFSDAQYNSSTAAGSYANTSEIPPMPNDGLRKQAIVGVGNSLLQSQIGAAKYTEFNDPRNRMWSKGLSSTGLSSFITPLSSSLYTYLPSTAPRGPEFIRTDRLAHEKSRIIFNFGRDSGRLRNIPGYTYSQGYNWVDNFGQMQGMVTYPGQQVVLHLFMSMSNDIKYADDNSNPGLAPVPGSSPNAIDDCLKPFLALFKAEYPGTSAERKVIYTVEAARSTDTVLNGKFNTLANYLIANKVALGIDFVIDTREITVGGVKVLDCRTPTNSTNSTYYQGDGVHFTPAVPIIFDPIFAAAYDACLGFPIPSQYASIIV